MRPISAGRLWRGARGQMVRRADGGRAPRRAAARGPAGPPLRLVLRAALGRLSRDADARLRADRLGHRLPVGGAHGRRQRDPRRLAERLRAVEARLPLSGAGALRRRRAGAPACDLLAFRLCAPGRPRQPAPGGGDRARRAAPAMGGLHARGVARGSPAGSSPISRAPSSRPTSHPEIGRCAPDGAARGRSDRERTDRRRLRLRRARGAADADDELLALRAGPRHRARGDPVPPRGIAGTILDWRERRSGGGSA